MPDYVHYLVPEPSLRQLRDGADTWPKVAYDADESDICREQNREMGWKLKPSIHMPRWASRITLEITDVRVVVRANKDVIRSFMQHHSIDRGWVTCGSHYTTPREWTRWVSGAYEVGQEVVNAAK